MPAAEQSGFGSRWSSRKDTTLICRAVLGGWDIPSREKPEILAHLQSLVPTLKGRRLARVTAAIAKLEADIRAAPAAAPGSE